MCACVCMCVCARVGVCVVYACVRVYHERACGLVSGRGRMCKCVSVQVYSMRACVRVRMRGFVPARWDASASGGPLCITQARTHTRSHCRTRTQRRTHTQHKTPHANNCTTRNVPTYVNVGLGLCGVGAECAADGGDGHARGARSDARAHERGTGPLNSHRQHGCLRVCFPFPLAAKKQVIQVSMDGDAIDLAICTSPIGSSLPVVGT